ncbi:hypothetical protein QMK33_18145 [Hymenobacter sp. H14-R3]|uniref:hypothetical protein n=1 Tax=Hymenobacter sp. H14-R3 TaxID=3046308 RepID=UPI0024B8C1A7|nr:hypothetical protein [Hymenobacter sp. H14-R3]MDJ0367075.1 hypothetical protein [Hymenobacter sp. H14-R3]
MEYPIYYELNFDGFKNSLKFEWELTQEEISEAHLSAQETKLMKKLLISALMAYNEYVDHNEYERVDLDGFGIQYVAYSNKKGEKISWINGFTLENNSHNLEDASSFEAHAVLVLDGGNRYFETTINLTTGTTDGIQIHGSA